MRRPTKRLASIALTRPRRGAFTLIEIMIVIVIIAILMALVLPAVQGIFGTTRNAQVQMEIKSIEQAIAGFKVQYGYEPPSALVLNEIASETSAANRAIIRKFWPRYDFTSTTNNRDWNNSGGAAQS